MGVVCEGRVNFQQSFLAGASVDGLVGHPGQRNVWRVYGQAHAHRPDSLSNLWDTEN